MTENKPIIIDGVDVLKEKINMCFILLLNKLETSETIEQTIYEHLDAFVEDWNEQLTRKTQECEDLKKEVQQALNKNAENYSNSCLLQKEVNQLKAENEEYKKKFQEFFNIDNQECWNTAFLQDEKAKSEQKLELIRKKVQAYIDDEADLTPEQVIQIIDEVE